MHSLHGLPQTVSKFASRGPAVTTAVSCWIWRGWSIGIVLVAVVGEKQWPRGLCARAIETRSRGRKIRHNIAPAIGRDKGEVGGRAHNECSRCQGTWGNLILFLNLAS